MNSSEDPPLVHLGLLAGVAVLLLIGGNVTFSDWGRVPVRTVGLYALGGILLHAASRYLSRGGLVLRGIAWLTAVGGALHLSPLRRPEVIVPLVALAAVDLALARSKATAELEVPPGALEKGIAGLASLAALVLLAVLVPLAQDALVLTRLGAVVVIGWALVAALAMRPAARTPVTLLGAAGAFSLAFLLLAGPVIPFGPLLSYWVAVLAVSLAVITATFTRSDPSFTEDQRRHEQTVRALPDPVLASLAERVRRFVESGQGAEALSRRVESALDRDEDGTLLPAMSEARARGTHPSRADRREALAELLGLDPDRLETEVS